MSKDTITMNSMCTYFNGDFQCLCHLPRDREEINLSEEFSIAFRPIYCPLIFSISTTPIFGFRYTPRYNGLMKKWQLKILSHLVKYTQKQKDSFFPLHFCLQSAQHCWTEAFAAKVRSEEQLCHPGSSSHCASQTHARNRDSQKMQWPNLPPPYPILVNDTLLFNTGDKCLQILLPNI